MAHEAQAIIHGIVHHVRASGTPDYGSWKIGLTSDVPKAYERWGCPGGLVYWAAITLGAARAVESHFVNDIGMCRMTEGDLYSEETVRVCIFPRP
jgi:hypothetical protein